MRDQALEDFYEASANRDVAVADGNKLYDELVELQQDFDGRKDFPGEIESQQREMVNERIKG